ncbi:MULTISPECIES: sensor histidine kinase [Bacillus]|uniref:sensor histidine kinase n=1 Tax=Bacillus TaxID=1386 RepID=UPI0002F95AB8|nr:MULTISPECIES: histidine kinase [Bacillus]
MGYIRLVIFLLLYGVFFTYEWTNEYLSYFLLGMACSTALYYLAAPLKHRYYFQYIQFIILHILYIGSSNSIMLFIMLYIHFDSLMDVPFKKYVVQTCILTISIIIQLIYHQNMIIEWGLFLLGIMSFSLLYKQQQLQNEEKTDLYNGLLQEYRQLKRLAYKNEKVARLEERTRIARDIHDSVGHKLTSLLMLIKMKAMNNDDNYKDLFQLAEDSLQETRLAVKALQTEEHEGIGSVVQLIRKLESESHIYIAFTTKKGVLSLTLSNEQNVMLYRMLQEALTNAMKHAYSREVKVILSKTATEDLEFTVKNKVEKKNPIFYGFGLENMKKRMMELGGQLHVYYEDDQFVVRGSFPEKRRKPHAKTIGS